MFKVTCVGLKTVEYKRKADGKQITGIEVHFMREPLPMEKDMKGMVASTLYVSANDHSGFQNPVYAAINLDMIGKEIELVYSFDGKFNHLVEIKPVKAA